MDKIVKDCSLALCDAYDNLPYRWRFYIRWTFACIVWIVCIYADLKAAVFIRLSNYGVITIYFMKFLFAIYNISLWLLSLIYTIEFNREYCYYRYQLDRPVPPNVYQLNFHYNNIYECALCLDPFNPITFGNETILHCGHRYHSGCIAEWEWDYILKSSFDPYAWGKSPTCPTCRRIYTWQQKWDYMYTIAG